jgi:hypothetical protein
LLDLALKNVGVIGGRFNLPIWSECRQPSAGGRENVGHGLTAMSLTRFLNERDDFSRALHG